MLFFRHYVNNVKDLYIVTAFILFVLFIKNEWGFVVCMFTVNCSLIFYETSIGLGTILEKSVYRNPSVKSSFNYKLGERIIYYFSNIETQSKNIKKKLWFE